VPSAKPNDKSLSPNFSEVEEQKRLSYLNKTVFCIEELTPCPGDEKGEAEIGLSPNCPSEIKMACHCLGIVKRKFTHSPGLLSHQIRPPWASTIRLIL